MEVLEFLRVPFDGNNNANGDGYGGYKSTNGDGYGSGYGDGCSCGYGYGDNGDGYSYGNGSGYSSCGYGNGNGSGIAEINGMKVYTVDGVPTIITSIHGNYAQGYTIFRNTMLAPCYVAKCGGSFAHGETLHDAFRDAQAKEHSRMPEDKRVELFISEHPSPDEVMPNMELFAIHNMLTGSCEFGRREFCKNKGIDLDGLMTIRRFLELTRNAYGKQIIEKIIEKYQN